MTKEQALYHRDELRTARENAVKDAEAYDEIIFALERLGCILISKIGDLGKYKDEIVKLAKHSALVEEIPVKHNTWHTSAERLYDIVKDARNDAFHQGAFARHLTTHAIELAIVLEDALTTIAEAKLVGDFMVRGPVCASLWQPLSFVRQQMLVGSFSYLPLIREEQWCLISDEEVARYLLSANTRERRGKLAHTVEKAVTNGMQTKPTVILRADDPTDKFFQSPTSSPALICRQDDNTDLIGIITAYDLL